VTGFYVNSNVNSNHVLVFGDAKVAAKYAELFEAAWGGRFGQFQRLSALKIKR
jgi:hypothetical protein